MIDIIGTLRHIYRRANQIFDFAVATLRLQETGGTITTTGAEQDVYRNETPLGEFFPRKVVIDFTNQTAAETVVVRTYYRIASGGGLLKKDEETFAATQDPVIRNIELEPNRFGVQVTIERIGGAAQAYPWEVHYEG